MPRMIDTKVITLDPRYPVEDGINLAAKTIARGGLVIIPTETVYGVAANRQHKKAVERLYEIKQRPKDKPFTLHVDINCRLEEYAADIPVNAYKLKRKFWPGPLTMILKDTKGGTIGIRMPDDEVAGRIIAKSGVPVVVPSANLSGSTPPVTCAAALADLSGLVDLAVDAGPTRLGAESTIVDLTVEPFQVVREGAIKAADIQACCSRKSVLFICTGNSCRSVMAEALLKHRLAELGRTDVDVSSAGIMMLVGIGASSATREVLKKRGIDVSRHQSQRITPDMLKTSDIILVMDRMHEEKVLHTAPEVKNRVFLLKEFAKIYDNDLAISDPIGQSTEFYEQTLQVIKEAVDKVAELI